MSLLWPKITVSTAANEAAKGAVHVWAVPIGDSCQQWDTCWKLLSESERHRADQFRIDAPRRVFVAARAALRTLLGEYLATPPTDIALVAGANGKPKLDSSHNFSALHFNVAHSDDLALIAVTAGCELGVDVERLRNVEYLEQIAQRYFHPDEIESIVNAEPAARAEAFLRCWTGKEAVLKAVGSGVTGSLESLRVPTNEHNGTWVDLPGALNEVSTRCWLEPLAPADGYVSALACVGEQRPIHCFTFCS